MDILDGLNDQQRRAVTHTNGPMLVVAGAGTGKTQVITRRIAYLLQQGLASPEQVLALTFTERAAREMQDRLNGLIGWKSFQVPVMTFHAFGAELLGRYATHVGRSVRGGLLNDTQKALLLYQHIGELELEYYDPGQALFEFISGVVEYISRLQNASIGSETYMKYAADVAQNNPEMHPRDQAEQRDLARLYQLYEALKIRTGTYDYHDQMMLPLQILQQHPNLMNRLRVEYKYILVDEYQDTNVVQDQLLQLLAGVGGNIFAVGDDDQAIYGFRGAEIGNILSFTEHFGLTQPIVLIQNYRSGQQVLDASYRLIGHNNPERLEAKLGLNKRLVAQHNNAEVTYQAYEHPSDELHGILEEVQADLDRGLAPAKIAVLSATHAPLKSLAKLFRSRGVPFNLSTSVNIFEQPELLTLWYLLTWIAGKATPEAVSHVLLGRYLGWSLEDYHQLQILADQHLCSLEEALSKMENDSAVSLSQNLATWRGWTSTLPASQIVFKLVFETETAERWRNEAMKSQRMVRVFEDLQRWLEQIQDIESVSIDGTLTNYLAMFPEPPQLEVQEPIGDADGVCLLTVHAAKGLEFEHVYVVNAIARSWSKSARPGRVIPGDLIDSRALSDEREYRRLFYVALTRAKQKVVVSFSTKTASGNKQGVTPFVSEAVGDVQLTLENNLKSDDKFELLMTKLQRFYPLQEPLSKYKLPFEADNGWIELGVTSLAAYDYCPFEFYLQYGLKLTQPMGPQLAFGTILHRVFELYYRTKMNNDSTNTLLFWQKQLDELWSDQGYETAEMARKDHELARTTLANFWKREESIGRRVQGVELPIRFELPQYKLRLRGKIDAVFIAEEGVCLRDYKTGRSKTDAEKLAKAAKDNFQLRTYALAYEKLGMGSVSEVALDYVVTGVEGRAKYSATIMKNHEAKLGLLADRIREHDFAPQPNIGHVCAALKYYGTGEQDDLALQLMSQGEVTE